MVLFRLSPEADTNETFGHGEILLAPARLVARFGPPSEGDGYKVSGCYSFSDDAGNVYTVYDWKNTSLFDDQLQAGQKSAFPGPRAFWAGEKKVSLKIGGRSGGDVEAFKEWLLAKVEQ
jgi:hypothetical protein